MPCSRRCAKPVCSFLPDSSAVGRYVSVDLIFARLEANPWPLIPATKLCGQNLRCNQRTSRYGRSSPSPSLGYPPKFRGWAADHNGGFHRIPYALAPWRCCYVMPRDVSIDAPGKYVSLSNLHPPQRVSSSSLSLRRNVFLVLWWPQAAR